MKLFSRLLLPLVLTVSYLPAQCNLSDGVGTFKNDAPPNSGLEATWLVDGDYQGSRVCVPNTNRTVGYRQTGATHGIIDVNYVHIRANTSVYYAGQWKDERWKLQVGRASVTAVRDSSGPSKYRFVVTGTVNGVTPKWVLK